MRLKCLRTTCVLSGSDSGRKILKWEIRPFLWFCGSRSGAALPPVCFGRHLGTSLFLSPSEGLYGCTVASLFSTVQMTDFWSVSLSLSFFPASEVSCEKAAVHAVSPCPVPVIVRPGISSTRPGAPVRSERVVAPVHEVIMSCTHPLTAYRLFGQTALGFNQHDPRVISSLQVACGQCIMCRLSRASSMGIRCMHEASLYGMYNGFFTLTYNDDSLPRFGSLVPRDLELFNKRMREYVSRHASLTSDGSGRLRFYGCGEYGEKFKRPHYHEIIFNCRFDDLRYWKKSGGGDPLYRSSTLEKLWPYGDAYIGEASFKSAAYVARYCLDVVTGDAGREHYRIIDPRSGKWLVDPDTGECLEYARQFSRMSTHPGIGAAWLREFEASAFPCDYVVVDGAKRPVPAYYDRLIARDRPELIEALKWQRELRAEVTAADRTPERLLVHEAVKVASMSRKGSGRL